MVNRYFLGLLLFLCPSVVVAQSAAGGIELVRNDGQWDGPFRYKASTSRAHVFLEDGGFTYLLEATDNSTKAHDMKHGKGQWPLVMRYHAYRVRLLGARPAKIVPGKIQPHYYNYFLGSDSSRWKSNIHPALALDYQESIPAPISTWPPTARTSSTNSSSSPAPTRRPLCSSSKGRISCPSATAT
jgi:hypothetical protein